MYSAQTTAVPALAGKTAAAAPASLPEPDGAAAPLAAELIAARERVRALLAVIEGNAWLGPCLPIVNPPLWELGHLGWFQERWLLRQRADGSLAPSRLPGADELYDSARVTHASRWSLPLPSPAQTWRYLDDVLDRSLQALHAEPARLGYFAWLAAQHEQMHAEALRYTLQTHGAVTPAEAVAGAGSSAASAPPCTDAATAAATARAPASGAPAAYARPVPGGDVEFAGGRFELGAAAGADPVFDNEKWAHPVQVTPFAMARCATSQGEFAAFVEDGGYHDRRWWDADGWAWRQRSLAAHPAYWRACERVQGWEVRSFERWQPLDPALPVLHVNAFEAQAWCRWAGRRLPTEAEWEFAARAGADGRSANARRFPWGDAAATSEQASLWWPGAVSTPQRADALAAGDSPAGCRQLIGGVWEWTASAFEPYPGFVVDPYREYSQPWFGTHRVLRGGCLATSATLIRNTWRNFYTPDRRDVFAGFRSCAVTSS